MWYVPFSEREQWKDVVPVPQDDGPNPVVPIQYSQQFRETMDYFRAILQSDERSERALELTEAVINLNAANYTVWAFRRACLDSLGKDWSEELRWVTEMAADNPKNYQIWQHRRCCVDKDGNGGAELLFLNGFLNDPYLEDQKNYHAWAHRQWVVRRFQLWEEDRHFIEELLRSDVRNNSAWNQRYFAVENSTDMSLDVRAREIEWALDKTKVAPHNESAWTYMRSMLHPDTLSSFPALQEAVVEYGEVGREGGVVTQAVEMRAEDLAKAREEPKREEAKRLYTMLATELDVIRSKYWAWKASCLTGA